MALRNQPYIPLYVQDFMTDEALRVCSAQANGVYIWIMCRLHKSKEYGTILLKQKDKQNDKQILDFATRLASDLPFPKEIIAESLQELIEEEALIIEGDKLIQKRMVKDNYLSEVRASAGSKGGKNSQNNKQNKSFANNFAQAKTQANHEYEYESEIESENNNSLNNNGKISKKIDPWCSTEKTNFENVYKKVFGDKPFLMNDDCNNLSELLEQIEDFESTLETNLKKLKNINFEKIGYRPKSDWFLKPKNYAALRMGTYDKQIEDKNENDGYNY